MTALLQKRRGGPAARRAIGRARRHFRVRKRISGTAAKPRLVVTRSLRHITAQLVDDTVGHTLACASSMEASLRGTPGDKKAKAAAVGAAVAQRALSAGISQVVFDRGGNRYGGRIAALADAARDAGLKF